MTLNPNRANGVNKLVMKLLLFFKEFQKYKYKFYEI